MKRQYDVIGFDQYGNRKIETITIEHVPWYQRVIRRIGWMLVFGRWKRVSGIKIELPQRRRRHINLHCGSAYRGYQAIRELDCDRGHDGMELHGKRNHRADPCHA